MAYINSIYNAGNDYPQYSISRNIKPGPTPPGPIPPGPTPEPKVDIYLTVMQNVLSISASGDVGRVTGYQIKIYNNDELIGTYDIGNDVTEFDLNDIGETLDIGFYQITVTALFDDGTKSDETVPIDWYNTVPLPACAPMTLRFKFSKADYAPVDSETGTAVTTKGTWNKLDAGDDNIWDWTYDDPDWSKAFQGVFDDPENEASVIDAGDTSGVTSLEQTFAGIFTNWSNQSAYKLTTRNNLVQCIPFNIDNVTSIKCMFTGTALSAPVYFNFDNNNENCDGEYLFADTYIETIGDIKFKVIKANGIFARCYKLTKVGIIYFDKIVTRIASLFWSNSGGLSNLESVDGIIGTDNVTTMQTMFHNCAKLTRIKGKINCSSVNNFQAFLLGCKSLEEVPELEGIGNALITQADYMFGNCYLINKVPLFDTSHVTNVRNFISACYELEEIPDYDFSSVTNVYYFAVNSYKIKYGILETYNKFVARGSAITNHTNAFLNCGQDTEEGSAQLYQIPQDWGGLMQ